MDWFSLFFNGAALLGQGTAHLIFMGRLTGRRARPWQFAAYCAALCLVDALSVRLGLDEPLPIAAGVLALHAVSRFWLGNQEPVSWLGAVLAFYVSQLSFGLLNSVEVALFPQLVGSPLLYGVLAAALAAYFGLCALCYRGIRKLLAWTEDSPTPQAGLLLFPGLFFFAAELYILRTAYSAIPVTLPPGEAGRQAVLFGLQGMGLAALLCTLYAYRQLCQGFRDRAALDAVTQAAQAQRVYVTEAQARYDRTKSFRHDVKNHLSVLDGLLASGRTEEARAYLDRLEAVSGGLSLPCRTGNPVVDILLGEKLGLVDDVAAEVSLSLPRPCGIDDFDLCVIFANALDNALAACKAVQGPKTIRVSGRRQGDFYLLAFENPCTGAVLPPPGTGLSNIRSVAEKYRGAVLTEQAGGRFSLSVLLDIS